MRTFLSVITDATPLSFILSCPCCKDSYLWPRFEGACDIGFFGNDGGGGATVLKKLCASAVETDMRRCGSKCSKRVTRSRNCMRKLLVTSVIRLSTLMISCMRCVRIAT